MQVLNNFKILETCLSFLSELTSDDVKILNHIYDSTFEELEYSMKLFCQNQDEIIESPFTILDRCFDMEKFFGANSGKGSSLLMQRAQIILDLV